MGKIGTKRVFLAVAITLTACGEKLASSRAPSSEFIRQMQNGSGCLDLDKLSLHIAASKRAIRLVPELGIQGGDTPVSEAFVRSVVHNSDLKPTPFAKGDLLFLGLEQKGCASLESKTTTIKLIKATPTEIATERFGQGDDKDFPAGYSQISWKLVADDEVEVSLSMPFTTPHASDCAPQELHEVDSKIAILWGEKPLVPAASKQLESYKRRAADYDDPSQSGRMRDLESAYCRLAGKPRAQ